MSVTGWFRISVECKGGILITAGYEREKMSSLFSGTGEKKDCSHRRLSAVLVLDLLWFLWPTLSPICPRVVCSFVRAYCRRRYALSLGVVGSNCWRTWHFSPVWSRGVSRLGGRLLFSPALWDWIQGLGDVSVCGCHRLRRRVYLQASDCRDEDVILGVRGRRIWGGWADCMLWHRWQHRQLCFSVEEVL